MVIPLRKKGYISRKISILSVGKKRIPAKIGILCQPIKQAL